MIDVVDVKNTDYMSAFDMREKTMLIDQIVTNMRNIFELSRDIREREEFNSSLRGKSNLMMLRQLDRFQNEIIRELTKDFDVE